MPPASTVALPWWAVVPLRAFLGVTFSYAGLQKLADPAYLDGSSALSVQRTIASMQHHSPIGFLLGWSAHAPVLVGVLIAVGELAVGLATIAGLWVRVAAAGGFVLALTFFLTVSWRTRPYYYGSDVVFMAAWSLPLLSGTWGRWTIDEVIGRKVAAEPEPGRRRLLLGAGAAGVLGVVAAAVGGATAVIGRTGRADAGRSAPLPSPTPTTGTASPVPRRHPTPDGRVIARAADVPAGSAVDFTDDTGAPAVLVHEPSGDFRAFSAVCTHAGCTVSYDGAGGLVCPCHGGRYDAATGSVLGGPPPAPLAPIDVDVAGGEVRLSS